MTAACRSICWVLLVWLHVGRRPIVAAFSTGQAQQQATYKYFAIGSNMVPATMTSLRNLEPISSTAAILPDYQLAFDIPGNPFLEPSAASVRPCSNKGRSCQVHGVLYELSDKDFVRLGSSEAVPFVYSWQQCRVMPYVGDGERAGQEALGQLLLLNNNDALQNGGSRAVSAFVLTAGVFVHGFGPASSRRTHDIPPSRSYLKVLRFGATFWKMDRDYQQQLADITVSKTTPGFSDLLLQAAKRLNPKTETRP